MPITKATASSIAPAAKGDLVVGSATNDAAVLGVGSANQVLTVDSSTATGLKWAAPASGLTYANAYTQTEESTSSTSYTGLTTATSVTLTTGTNALVLFGFNCKDNIGAATFDVSGATTSTGDDARALMIYTVDTKHVQATRHFVITGLTAGSNTFTMKFRSPNATTVAFARRNITVIDLGS